MSNEKFDTFVAAILICTNGIFLVILREITIPMAIL